MSRTRAGDPRNTAEYRRNKLAMFLCGYDVCWLCHHAGARTADHVVTVEEWLRLFGTFVGVNNVANLRPAHGTGNHCPTCGLACNQVRGTSSAPAEPHSRPW